jgi:hypothetical protein
VGPPPVKKRPLPQKPTLQQSAPGGKRISPLSPGRSAPIKRAIQN